MRAPAAHGGAALISARRLPPSSKRDDSRPSSARDDSRRSQIAPPFDAHPDSEPDQLSAQGREAGVALWMIMKEAEQVSRLATRSALRLRTVAPHSRTREVL